MLHGVLHRKFGVLVDREGRVLYMGSRVPISFSKATHTCADYSVAKSIRWLLASIWSFIR